MRQDQAAEIRDVDRVAIALLRLIGNRKQGQRCGTDTVPAGFDRGDLGGLILKAVEPVAVAEEDLQRDRNRQQPQRHGQHAAGFFDKAAATQIKRGDADHDKAGRDVERDHGMHQAIRKGRVENDLQPVLRKKAAVDDLVPNRRLHPTIGGEDPEGREQGSCRHHQCRHEMCPARHQPAPEQQHAEKGGFEKKGGEPFIGEQRRQHVGRRVGKAAPIRAELERHDDAGYDTHAERDREDAGPEGRQPEIDVAAGREIERLQQCDIACQPDRERRQQDVERDHPGELQARQEERIEDHWQQLARGGAVAAQPGDRRVELSILRRADDLRVDRMVSLARDTAGRVRAR